MILDVEDVSQKLHKQNEYMRTPYPRFTAIRKKKIEKLKK
jgi:hypothetical protein